MNWLAHVYLSSEEIDFRLGNLLADVVRGPARNAMSPAFQAGIRCHLAIDSFTDAHALVRRSKARLRPPHRRYAGILVDLFYDHFLAVHWPNFAETTLSDYVGLFYTQAQKAMPRLPTEARGLVEHMIAYDRLRSYRDIQGIEQALRRLSARWAQRFPRAAPLHEGVVELQDHYTALEKDFLEFFPQLRAHVQSHLVQESITS